MSIVDIHGQKYRVTMDENGARTYEPIGELSPEMAARLERNRTMRGNSRRKSGG